jgi:uncharacterized membrane protein
VADYRHVEAVLEGVSEWRPLGRAEGKGARYEVRLGLLPVPIRARLVLVEWERPHTIAWDTESSLIVNRGRWTFRQAPAGTLVELALTYQPPAGAVGNYLAARVESAVTRRIIKALDGMQEALER